MIDNSTHEFTRQDEAVPGPGRAILAFTRKELKIFRALKAGGRDAGLLFGQTSLTAWDDLLLAGPILGAPQAAMVLENLRRRGVKSYLSLGWCGSLQPELTWGDIVLPDRGVSEEGTSALYPIDEAAAFPDEGLSGELSGAMKKNGLDFTPGPVWSTDAPYRETRDKVLRYAGQGVLAVDMETSAVITVARFHGLAWSGLLVVSDELWGEKWRPGFNSRELNNGLKRAAETILQVFN